MSFQRRFPVYALSTARICAIVVVVVPETVAASPARTMLLSKTVSFTIGYYILKKNISNPHHKMRDPADANGKSYTASPWELKYAVRLSDTIHWFSLAARFTVCLLGSASGTSYANAG